MSKSFGFGSPGRTPVGILLCLDEEEMMKAIEALALVTGSVEQELMLKNEYVAAENEILRSKINGRIQFNDSERIMLAKLGKKLGRNALKDGAAIVKPETILEWFRRLVAKKFDGSNKRKSAGRPRIKAEIEALTVKLAEENPSWGHSRIVGALSNLGIKRCEQTVAEILRRHGIPPAPKLASTNSWAEFVRSHQHVIAAADFFTAEVITKLVLVTYYVLFFMHLDTRRVHIAGITTNPDEQFMLQIARNSTMQDWGFLEGREYLIIDRDSKYTTAFRAMIKASGVKVLRHPPKSPNLNAHCERWVLSVKSEMLSRMLFFDLNSLREALRQFVGHYHEESNHQGKGQSAPFFETRSLARPR